MYLFSPIGLRTPSNRSFIINEIPRHFGYQPVRLDLPTISVDDICQPGPIELVEIKPENFGTRFTRTLHEVWYDTEVVFSHETVA